MKKILMSLMVIAAMTSMEATAFDWASALNFLGRATEPQAAQNTVQEITDIEKQLSSIDNSVQTAFVNIVSELSGWRETRSVKSDLKSDSSLTEIISNYTNSYLAANKEAIAKKIKKMSASEKNELIKNLTTLSESGQNYLILAANGAKTVTNTLKTAQTVNEAATTLANINKTAVELRSRASTVYNFAKQVKAIASTAGMSIN